MSLAHHHTPRYFPALAWLSLLISLALIYSPRPWVDNIILPLSATLALGLCVIIDAPGDRLKKGFNLIFLGVIVGVLIPFLLGKRFPDAEAWPESLQGNLELVKNMALLACGGAGGSVIANHAEHLYTSQETLSGSANSTTNSTLLQINAQLATMKKMLWVTLGIMGLLFFLLAMLFFYFF